MKSQQNLVKDDSQPVSFSSIPQGATVYINEILRGTTPMTIMVKRSASKQMLKYELEGYHSITFKLEKSVAGMTFGNIIFGGIIGAAVDTATGKATNYQDHVHIKMIPETGPIPSDPKEYIMQKTEEKEESENTDK